MRSIVTAASALSASSARTASSRAVSVAAADAPNARSRRAALATLARVMVVGACGACGGSASAPTEDPDLVTREGNELVVRLDRATTLRQPNSALVLGEHQVIVLRLGDADYRAFTNVCTHAGCGIHEFREQRLRCPCHGSEYDVDGRNVAGPAPEPLRRYPVRLDAALAQLRITTA